MAVRFLIYTAILYGGFVHNIFCVQEDALTVVGEFRSGYLTGDCTLAINRMRSPDNGPWAPMASWSPGIWTPYRSQFGLSAVVLAGVQRATGAAPEKVAAIGSAFYGLLAAALLAAFFASVATQIAPLAGHVGVLLSACSPPLLAFAPSLYWTLPATLAPFVFAWLAYPWSTRSPLRAVAFLAGLAILVLAKSLCGYEYISTVVASPAAAIVFHRAATGEGWRKWLLPVAAVGIAGVVGFTAAIGIHAQQISEQTGESGLATIRSRASARTSLPSGEGTEAIIYPVFAPESLPQPARCFANYFYQPILSSPQTWGGARFLVPLGALVAAAAFALVLAWRNRAANPAAAALAPATFIALLGGMSWQALAVNHMVFHGHLNLIVYCVPFAPLAFAALGAGVARLGYSRAVAVALGLAAIGIPIGNVVVVQTRAEERRLADESAVERVRAMLRGESKAVPLGEKGPPPIVALLPLDPPYLPNVAAFTPKYAPAVPEGERPTGIYGWVRLPRERSSRFPMSIVCVRGSDIVPSRVGYFRLTAVEQLHGKQIACVAFHAVIPPKNEPGERLRVYAVPTQSSLPIIELMTTEP